MKKLSLITFISFVTSLVSAQTYTPFSYSPKFNGNGIFTGSLSVGQNSGPNSSAIFEVYSTNKGFLMPRLSTLQRNSINYPSVGLMIYNTTSNAFNFYNGSSWSAIGAGNVTSVAMTVPSFLSVAGSPVTTSGTLAVSLSGTALPVANGGTGLTSYVIGDIIYASGATTLSKLPIGTASQQLRVNAGATALEYFTPTGADGWSLTGNSGTNPTTNFIGTTDSVGFSIQNFSHTDDNAIRIYGTSDSTAIGISLYGGNSKIDSGGVGVNIYGTSISKNGVFIQGSSDSIADIHIIPSNGKLQIINIGEGSGKVLTSDADGMATWQPVTNTAWGLTGNAGTDPNVNFLGTLDSVPISISNRSFNSGDEYPAIKIEGFADTIGSGVSISGESFNADGYVGLGLTGSSVNDIGISMYGNSTKINTPDILIYATNGKLRISNLGEGNGKVLTTDISGNATWESISEADASTIPAYANNAAAVIGIGAGKLYYTDVAGEYIVKISH